MKHSIDNPVTARKIVKKIIQVASVDTVSELIEDRFACFMFHYNRRKSEYTVDNNKEFHALIIEFLKTIYQTEQIDEELLLARGLFVIENFCQGHLGKGYEGVYYDILNHTASITEFLMTLVDGLKDYEQYKFIEVICIRHIDPCDHALKYAVVKEIGRKYGHLFPDGVCEHPENFISHIPKLITSIISSNDIFSGIINR